MTRSLRDDLASLKIDRSESQFGKSNGTTYRPVPASRTRPSGGLGRVLIRLVVWSIPLGLVGTGGYLGWQQYQEIKARPEVATTVVQSMTSGEARKLLSAKGYLKSRNQAVVGAKYPGRVESLFFEEGTRVKKGQVLAVIEHNQVDAQLETRKAMILRAKAELEEARVELAEKVRRATRASRLSQNGTISTEEVDQTSSAAAMTTARLHALEASIKYQEAMVRETQEQLKDMEVVAPFDGTVVHKDAEVGEIITGGGLGSGLSIGRATVATIADLSKMDVETDISEGMISLISLGQPTEIDVTAVKNRRYHGTLRRIIPMSERARGTVKVLVGITDPDEHLFPELVATVHFLPEKNGGSEDAGKLRMFAVKTAVVTENGSSSLWVIENEKVRKVPIKTSDFNGDLVQIESGVKSGETIVNNPDKSLQDGLVVKIKQ